MPHQKKGNAPIWGAYKLWLVWEGPMLDGERIGSGERCGGRAAVVLGAFNCGQWRVPRDIQGLERWKILCTTAISTDGDFEGARWVGIWTGGIFATLAGGVGDQHRHRRVWR
ncbi:hypothetical protein EDD85DRAFT_795459 [Armillaria nabsnona]|nr:hypothetical protein EDD85DRAFT_795459 [Armillaria nabsnona]